MVHENYFDVVMEENLLVVIQTRNEKKIISRKLDVLIFVFTFFSICVCEDDANADAIVSPRILSKCDDDEDEFKEFVCWLFRSCWCCCFINNCCVNADDDDDDDDGCPIVVHCFPPPTEPNIDGEFEPSDDGTVDTPPLLLTCK